MKRVMVRVAALWMLLGASGTLAAQIPEFEGVKEPQKKVSALTVGLGVAAVPDYEGSQDYTAAPILYFSYKAMNGMSAELLGNVLRANVIPSDTWRFGPELRYRAERKDVENEKVDRMKEVDAATELGAYAGFDMNNWSLKLDATHDTSGVYNGTVGGISLGYTWLANPWKVTLSAATTFADDRYMRAYFGVTPADAARSGLRRWEPGGGVKDVGATCIAGYRINQNWGVTGALRYTQLLDDAADSPLVDDEGSASQVLFGVMATYSF